MGLGIHKYQDQIQELSSQVTQPIKDAFGVLGLHLGEAKDKILVFLDDLKGKVMSLPSALSSTADDQDTGDSTAETSTRSFLDDLKEKVMSLPSAFSSTAEVQDDGASTSTRSIVGRIKNFVMSLPSAFSSTADVEDNESDNGHSADGISIRHHSEPEF